MIQPVYEFVKKDRTHALFPTTSFYSQCSVLLRELHAPHLKQEKTKCSIFSLFLDTNIKQTYISSHSTTFLLISIIRHRDYDKKKISKRKETKADVHETKLL